jgi:hypothetical protein
MDSIIGGIEEVYRDNSRNGTFASRTVADNRCHNYDYGPCSTCHLVKGQSTRLVRLTLRSLCRCSPSNYRSRVW